MAGEIRTVEISKGAQQFQFRQYIQTGMSDVHRRLVRARFFMKLSRSEFSKQVAVMIGDANFVQPFREGNGRSISSFWAIAPVIQSILPGSMPPDGSRRPWPVMPPIIR